MTATHSNREKFLAELIRRAPATDYSAAQRFMRYSSTVYRLTNQYPRTFAEDRKLERIISKIKELAADCRCTIEFNAGVVTLVCPDSFRLEVVRI